MSAGGCVCLVNDCSGEPFAIRPPGPMDQRDFGDATNHFGQVDIRSIQIRLLRVRLSVLIERAVIIDYPRTYAAADRV